MNITLPKQLEQEMKRVSKVIGISEEERALRFYVASIRQELELEQELHAWNHVSDKALLNMERVMLQ